MRRVVLILFALLLSYSMAEGFSITLAWDANTEPDLAGYSIYYGRASGDYSNSIDVRASSLGWSSGCGPVYDPFKAECCEFTIYGLEEGEYFFAATAEDNDKNESAYSEELTHIFSADKIDSEISSPNDLHKKEK
jgi:hypothetical protein